jgi:hypothetical protein
MAVIQGTSGDVKISSVSIGKLTSCEISIDQETTTQGPFIGDPATTTVRTGLSATVSCEGVMETPTNAGQQDIIDAIMAGTDAAMVIEIDDPAEQTFTGTVILTNVTIGLDTGEGAPFSFEGTSSGAFTVVAAA